MRHLAAYLLLVVGGNTSPSSEDVTKLLGTVGVEVDAPRLEQLLSELQGKSVEELIYLGQDKLYVGGGGGGSVAVSAGIGVINYAVYCSMLITFVLTRCPCGPSRWCCSCERGRESQT